MLFIAGMLMAGVPQAHAQGAAAADGKMFASIEFGAQPTQRTITSSTSFSLYDETATVTTTQPIHNGPIFGGSVGYRVMPTVGVSIGLTIFSARSSDAAIVASVPDLLVFNQPKTVTATATGLAHKEVGFHAHAVWFHPVSEKLEVVLAAGPAIVNVKHDVATAAVTAGTQSVTTTTTTQSKSALGFDAGFEGNYRLAPQYLVGLFVRYSSATAQLPDVPDLKVGGLQTGLGLRVRF